MFSEKIAIPTTNIDILFLEKMICNKCKHRHCEKDIKKKFSNNGCYFHFLWIIELFISERKIKKTPEVLIILSITSILSKIIFIINRVNVPVFFSTTQLLRERILRKYDWNAYNIDLRKTIKITSPIYIITKWRIPCNCKLLWQYRFSS